jgi:uncharacterized protein YlbG (UPF0298 family)
MKQKKCPFKYHPDERYYEGINGEVDTERVWQTLDEHGNTKYIDEKGNYIILKNRENTKEILCHLNDFECVGEKICPITRKK